MQEQALLTAIVQNLKCLCRFKRRRPKPQTGVSVCQKTGIRDKAGGVLADIRQEVLVNPLLLMQSHVPWTDFFTGLPNATRRKTRQKGCFLQPHTFFTSVKYRIYKCMLVAGAC